MRLYLAALICIATMSACARPTNSSDSVTKSEEGSSRYIFSAYAGFDLDRSQVVGCQNDAANCRVPAGAKLENCVLTSDRYPQETEYSTGSLFCDLVQNGRRSDLKDIKLDLSVAPLTLSNVKLKFKTFKDFQAIKDGREKIEMKTFDLVGSLTLDAAEVAEFKNIVWGGGFDTGITLSIYYSDVLIRKDLSYKSALEEACGQRGRQIAKALGSLAINDRADLKPYLAGLANACEIKP